VTGSVAAIAVQLAVQLAGQMVA